MRRILIIDDDPEIARLLKYTLEKQGDTVDLAPNGREALSSIVENSPDILFLDIMMPELDGFQVVEAVHQLKPVPRIFIMTAKSLTPQEKIYLEKRTEMIFQKGTQDLAEFLKHISKDPA